MTVRRGDSLRTGEVSNIRAMGKRDDMSDDIRQAPQENPAKDPSDWTTGDEPMTGPQRSYLQTLAQEAGREAPEELTKAHASELIDELQQRTGRGSA